MAENWEKAYLETLCEELNDNSYDAFMEDIDGEPALIIPLESSEDGDFSVKIDFEHVAPSSCQLQIMVELFCEIDEEIFTQIDRVVARINQYLTVGNLAVFYKGRALLYNYALLFMEDMQLDTVTRLLGSALEIIGLTAAKIIELLRPFIKGEVDAQTLIDSGISIVQGGN